jgi:hypothetical protein
MVFIGIARLLAYPDHAIEDRVAAGGVCWTTRIVGRRIAIGQTTSAELPRITRVVTEGHAFAMETLSTGPISGHRRRRSSTGRCDAQLEHVRLVGVGVEVIGDEFELAGLDLAVLGLELDPKGPSGGD